MLRFANLALVLSMLCSAALADVVTERWGAGAPCRHTEAVSFTSTAGGPVAQFDLSALPKKAKIHRARLLVGLRPDGFPQAEPIVIKPLAKPAGENAAPEVEDKPLALAGPRYASFDATDVVSRWASGKLANHGLLLRGPTALKSKLMLEISYEGQLKDPPPPATDLKCFYRAGQVFMTWKEIDNKFFGQEDLTFKDYSTEMKRIRDGKGPVITYRVYRHTKPITAKSLGEAELLDEVGQFSCFDERMVKTEWKGEQIKNVKVDDARVPRTAVEPKAELPVGVGVFVANTVKDGSYHYAVVSTVDGLENTTQLNAGNTTQQAIQEKLAPSEPILFGETQLQYQKERKLELFVWWVAAPLNHLPNFIHVGVTTGPKLANPAPAIVHGYWWSGGWNTVHPCPQEEGVTLQLDDHPWQVRGIHEGNGTLKAYSQGKIQNYYVRQVKAFIDWAEPRYHIDRERMYAFSSGWAWHYPELFAATFEVLTMNPKRSPAMPECRRYWGDPKNPPPTEWGMSPYEHWNAGEWIRNNPKAELAHMSYTPYQHTGDFGRLDKPPFFAAMRDTRRGFACAFDESRGWYGTADAGWLFQVRKSDSMAAFTNCTLDDDPGIGAGGDPGGQINCWLAFDARTQVDDPAKWEMTLYLLSADKQNRAGAPLDACTADVTPRRCQKFTAKPGQSFTWTNTSLANNEVIQTGKAVADPNGLVTAQKVLISKGKNRLVLQREK